MSQSYQVNVQVDDEFIEQLSGATSEGDSGVTQNTLRVAAVATLKMHDLGHGMMTIVLTGDAEVQALNLSFLGIDAPTDVLSFPNHNSPAEPSLPDSPRGHAEPVDLPPELAAEQEAYLGDLVIALPYARKQAVQHQRTLAEELSLLVVHGTLHLLGYDHVTVEEENEMWATQADVLGSLGMVVPVESRSYEHKP